MCIPAAAGAHGKRSRHNATVALKSRPPRPPLTPTNYESVELWPEAAPATALRNGARGPRTPAYRGEPVSPTSIASARRPQVHLRVREIVLVIEGETICRERGEPLGLCAQIVDDNGQGEAPVLIPNVRGQGGRYRFRVGAKLTSGPGWARASLRALCRESIRVGVLHHAKGLVGEFRLPLKTLGVTAAKEKSILEGRAFTAPRIHPPRAVHGADGSVLLVHVDYRYAQEDSGAWSTTMPSLVSVDAGAPPSSPAAQLLMRQNRRRQHELCEAASRASGVPSAKTHEDLDAMRGFCIDQFGSLRAGWSELCTANRRLGSPRSVSGLSSGTTDTAIGHGPFEAAAAQLGFKGNASAAWLQLSGSKPPRPASARPASARSSGRGSGSDAASVASRASKTSSRDRMPTRVQWAPRETAAEEALRQALARKAGTVLQGVRLLQKRSGSAGAVAVLDLLSALEPHGFGRPELKKLCPGLPDNATEVEWAQLGLKAESRRPEPPPPLRVTSSISELRGLLSAAAHELRRGAQVAAGPEAVGVT